MQVFLAKLVALFLSFRPSFVHVMCITNYSYLQNLVWYIFRLQLPQKVYSLQSKPICCPKVTFPNFAKIFTSPVWEILIRKPISYLIHLGLDSYIISRTSNELECVHLLVIELEHPIFCFKQTNIETNRAFTRFTKLVIKLTRT